VVLRQQIGERLVGKFLHAFAFVAGEQLERLPSFRVEAEACG